MSLRITRLFCPHGAVVLNSYFRQFLQRFRPTLSRRVERISDEHFLSHRFVSLGQLSLVDSAVLTSTGPVLTRLPELAMGSVRRPTALVVSLLATGSAIMLLVIPDTSSEQSEHTQGLIWAFTSSFLLASQQLFSDATAGVPHGVLLLYSSFVSLVASMLLAGLLMERPDELFTQNDMGVMALVSQMAFSYVYFIAKAREANDGLVNMYKYSLDVILACALTPVFVAEPVSINSHVAAVLVVFAVVLSELHRVTWFANLRNKYRFVM